MCLQEKIVQPHLKHDFDMLCKIKKPEATEGPSSLSSRLYNFVLGLFSRKGYHVMAEDVKTEL
jgi:multiple inositol-polyphosphate phosphatase/2,3-bisphosphoglycerate 3-phosphatase